MTLLFCARSLGLARIAKEKAEDAVTTLGEVASDGTEIVVTSGQVGIVEITSL